MTRLLIISIALLLPVGLAFSQEKPQAPTGARQETRQQETERPENERPEAEESKDNASPQFIDEDGDGINDRTQARRRDGSGEGRQMRNRGSDSFIDNDGDGINDQRCSGMGISGQNREHRGGKNEAFGLDCDISAAAGVLSAFRTMAGPTDAGQRI